MSRYTYSAKSSLAGQSPKKQLSVIILSSSPGYRMRSHGPKSTFKLGKKTLLDHQISLIKDLYPHSEIIVTVGYEADKIISHRNNVRIIENINFEETNAIEEIRLALNNIINTHILILDADLVIHENITKKLIQKCSSIIVDNSDQFDKTEVGVVECDKIATNFSYNIKEKWCSVVYLEGEELRIFKEYCTRDKNKRLFHEGILHTIDNGGKFLVEYTNGDRIYRMTEQ